MLSRRHLLLSAGTLALAGCAPLGAASGRGPVVETTAGRIRGVELADGVRVFRNVPFGENPYTPERRFLAPVPAAPRTGVRDCTMPGAIPYQPSREAPEMIGGGDALVLNLWAPADAKKAPVMVWIPGGGSTNCDNNDPRFDGTAFARDGIVLVTLNYRVNVDGFILLEDGDSNCGIRDMLLGLEWVKQNISAFGGDPDCVTVFGQSAGGTHTTSIAASPRSKDLIRRAIMQSPSAVAQWRNVEEARHATALLAKHYGIAPTRKAFSALSPEAFIGFKALVSELGKDPAWGRFSHGNTSLFKPFVDGDVLLERPVDAIRAGAARHLDILAGSTREEWRNYTVPKGAIDRIGYDAILHLTQSAGLPSNLGEAYRAAGHGRTTGEVFTCMQGDLIFRMPCNKLLEACAASGTPVHAYSFDWESPVLGETNQRRGAAHSSDVSFVFKTGTAPTAVRINGTNPPGALEEAMHSAWVSFAKTGNPGWETFDLKRRMTMCFNVTSAVVSDPWAFERRAMPIA